MNLEQVGLQLGIAGLMIVAGYRIALVLINNWRAAEKERTEAFAIAERDRTLAMAAGLTSIGDKVERHAQADLKSHADLTDRVARFEGKLDAVLDEDRRNTPPRGLYSYPPKTGG